ncbi:hypothetical protein ABK040_005771 [Willaertia magna]
MERNTDFIVLDRFNHFLATDEWNLKSNENIHKHIFPEKKPLNFINSFKIENDGVYDKEKGYSKLNKRPLFKDVYETFQKEKKPAKVGQTFGPSWSTFWFEVELQVPSEWRGKDVYFIWNSDSEALLFDRNGSVLQGLNGGDGCDKREEYKIDEKLLDQDGKVTFYIEMACNAMFGNGFNGLINPPQVDRFFTLKKAEIALMDRLAFDLMYDFKIIYECAKELDKNKQRSREAIHVGNQMLKMFDPNDRNSWQQARYIAQTFLCKRNGEGCHNIISVGHCHIDVAWLWSYAETRRKAARSFANQLRYMDLYPNYIFVQSQAQLYEWVKEDYPDLFEKIKEKVKEGRFIPVGGTWVEMDGVIPSGESFCRQFLYGQRFFKNEFGSYCTEHWLPDSFGYSGTLPQIMRQARIDCFVTQKLSWNLINKFPNSTFLWQGIDGSKVFAHFPPADTYNGSLQVKELLFTEENFKDKDISSHSLALFGHGDGGGGPVLDHMEYKKRLEDVSPLPKLITGTPNYFFEKVKDEHRENRFRTWQGELYLELHRGTLTSQASTKRGNRKCELILREAEMYASLAHLTKGATYPKEQLTKLWKLLLLNQFHDVLPGTSIALVYADVKEHHSLILKEANEIKENAIKLLSQEDSTDGTKETVVTFWNSLPWARKEIMEIDVSGIYKNENEMPPITQKSKDGKSVVIANIPSVGCKSVPLQDLIVESVAETESVVTVKEENSRIIIRNQFIEVKIDKRTAILDVLDLQTKRVLVSDGNRFLLYNDKPLFWDAWDLSENHKEKELSVMSYSKAVDSLEILEEGPLRVVIKATLNITGTTSLIQYITVTCLSPRIDFNTTVNWNEKHKCLKASFPSHVHSDSVTYDHQFGFIKRSNHSNTSWDVARFEVMGQKYAVISEYGSGVALMQDCKYGYSTKDNNTLCLTLLRSPKAPDEFCDMGLNEFVYSLYPYCANTFQDGRVIQSSYELNNPSNYIIQERVIQRGEKIQMLIEESLVSPSVSNVICETVKLAEDSTSDVVIRLYEAYGAHSSSYQLSLKTKQSPTAIVTTNVLEDKEERQLAFNYDPNNQKVIIQMPHIKPFEIVNIKVKF